MTISFAITVFNEIEEIKKILPFLLKHKRIEDEIIILFDEKNGSDEVLEYLLPFNKLPKVQTWRSSDWNENFGEWKNKLSEYCKGDFVYQIDADELISQYMIENLHNIIQINSDVDLFFVPRINVVENITKEDIDRWNWKQNEKGWVQFPDYQGRIYKKGLNWFGNVHEKIVGFKKYAILPTDEEYCIYHNKKIERQREQNNRYSKI
jgi:hypothetical protein